MKNQTILVFNKSGLLLNEESTIPEGFEVLKKIEEIFPLDEKEVLVKVQNELDSLAEVRELNSKNKVRRVFEIKKLKGGN